MTRFIVITILLATATVSAALGPSWYNCDPAKCTGACHCPSLTSAANISPADTPQFILITHDDAITSLANQGMRKITDGHKNPNGCNVPATFFTTASGTDCNLAKKLFNDNHELALHTVNHKALSTVLVGMEEEIMGAKTFLVKQCGIPAESLVGFRSPYLVHNQVVRGILAKNGILYDSSIEEFVGPDSKTTDSFGNRLWPYTLDNGIIQNCNWTYPSGQCQESERYPGMWEVPMWDLLNSTTSTERNAYTMDPAGGFGGDLYTTLTTNFDAAYNGNRAPFPLYIHAPWLTDSNVQLTNKFFEYALSKPNVYFVTITQLINWMKNPVPAAEVAKTLTCKAVDLEPPKVLKCQIYTVKLGDFMDNIAGKFGISNTTELFAANPEVPKAGNVQIGQKLKIPPWDNTCGDGVPAGSPDAPVVELQTPTPAAAAPVVAAAPADAASITASAPAAPAEEALPQAAPVEQPVPVSEQLPVPEQQPLDPAHYPENRIEMLFNLKGMLQSQFDAEMLNRFTITLSQVFGVEPSSLLVGLAGNKRRRALLQDGSNVPFKVVAIVATNDPLTTYYRTQEEIANGELESVLNALGLIIQGPPAMVVFRNGIALQFPDTKGGSAPTANAGEKKSGLSTGVIIGIAVGGAAVLAALIAGMICIIRRRKAKAEEKKRQQAQDVRPAYVGGTAQLSIKTIKTKGEDPFLVVKGGVDTPTSPTQRSIFKL